MPKRFTLAEAQSLLPTVAEMVREVVGLKATHDEAASGMRACRERIMLMGGTVVERTGVRETLARQEAAASRLGCLLEEIQELGCVVKDLDIGLVDFPTTFRGSEAYLCWKLGEPAIQFWHSIEEGFAGRKPIDDDFREHHSGDLPN
jgi:hypothetical protein